ncbi:MAG: protein kinase [Myxococcota bacterium]
MEAGVNLSQYRIVRRIGAGGMAEVFLASKVGVAGFSRPVAIKTIVAAGAAQESISLFLDEARVAAMLQHAAIVQTYDLGFENDTLFIAMEYVPGPPLSRVIQELKHRSRTMAPHMVAYIGARMANALDFAHRRVTTASGQALKLVHRDVSPQNILVSRTGMLKLMDFGVARASIQMHKTRTGQVRGKAAYMAPEQVRAQALDGRTDMFALGLVLYECLTAFRPFQRHNEIASMRAIIGEDVPPLADRNPDVPADLHEVIHKALKRNPNDRYANCGELEEALNKTIRKHRPSAIEQEIANLILDLFGQETFADELPDVEAWQPTMASSATPVTPRFKVPGAGLSPEIAAMLGQTPNTPAQPLTPATTAVPDIESLPRGVTQAPQRPPPQPPGTATPSRFPVVDAAGVPTSDYIQRVVDAANAQLTPASGSVNLRGTVGPSSSASNGQLQGVLYSTTPMLSPLSSPSIVGVTPPSLTSGQLAPSGRGRLILIIAASLLGGAGLVLILQNVLSPAPVTKSVPLASEAPVGVAPSSSPSVAVGSLPSPSPSYSAQPSPSATAIASPSPTASPSPSREARRRGSPSPSPSATVAAVSPSPSPKAAAPINSGALLKRALELKKKAEAAGQTSVANDLGSLINLLLANHEATAKDAELVRQAEAALP